jgi:hypothetical protein
MKGGDSNELAFLGQLSVFAAFLPLFSTEI